MSTARISLPSQVYEQNMARLVGMLGKGNGAQEVVLDFAAIQYYIPGAIVSLIARIKKWLESGTQVRLVNYAQNTAFQYFQRLDFFRSLGLDMEERFTRHTSSDFVPVEEIVPESHVATIAAKLARCVRPDGTECDVLQLLEFICSEAILNCRQHSRANGYAAAQYAPKRDMARIAVADYGRGILESFRGNGSPLYREGMSDGEALQIAVSPWKSSTTHAGFNGGPYAYGSPNAGVGLSMMCDLVAQSCGWMFLASGQAWRLQDGNKPPTTGAFDAGCAYPGTICAVGFMRGHVDSYQGMLAHARAKMGLQTNETYRNLFQ